MKRVIARLALLLVIGLSTMGSGCDPYYAVSGRVENCVTRKPIADAKLRVQLDGPNRVGRGRTRADGTFIVGVNELPDEKEPSDLSVKKEGFKDYDLHVTKPAEPQVICLTPVETPPTPVPNSAQ